MRPFLITQGLTLARRIPVGKTFQWRCANRALQRAPHVSRL